MENIAKERSTPGMRLRPRAWVSELEDQARAELAKRIESDPENAGTGIVTQNLAGLERPSPSCDSAIEAVRQPVGAMTAFGVVAYIMRVGMAR